MNEARRLLGLDRVFKERCLKLPDPGVSKTNRYAQSGQVMPDVFIQEHPRPGDNRHEVVYAPNNPILLVLEVLSRSTFRYDLGPKVEIHRAMGVRKYFRCTAATHHPARVRTGWRAGTDGPTWSGSAPGCAGGA